MQAVDRAQKYLDSLSDTCDEHRARRLRAEERSVIASRRLLLVKRQAHSSHQEASELQNRLDASLADAERTLVDNDSRLTRTDRTRLLQEKPAPSVSDEVMQARLARSEAEQQLLQRAVKELTDANKQLLERSLVSKPRVYQGVNEEQREFSRGRDNGSGMHAVDRSRPVTAPMYETEHAHGSIVEAS